MLKKKSLEPALYCVLKNVSHGAIYLHTEPFDLCNWGVNIKHLITPLHLSHYFQRCAPLTQALFVIFLLVYQTLFSVPQVVCYIIFQVRFFFSFSWCNCTYRRSTVATIERSEDGADFTSLPWSRTCITWHEWLWCSAMGGGPWKSTTASECCIAPHTPIPSSYTLLFQRSVIWGSCTAVGPRWCFSHVRTQ